MCYTSGVKNEQTEDGKGICEHKNVQWPHVSLKCIHSFTLFSESLISPERDIW